MYPRSLRFVRNEWRRLWLGGTSHLPLSITYHHLRCLSLTRILLRGAVQTGVGRLPAQPRLLHPISSKDSIAHVAWLGPSLRRKERSERCLGYFHEGEVRAHGVWPDPSARPTAANASKNSRGLCSGRLLHCLLLADRRVDPMQRKFRLDSRRCRHPRCCPTGLQPRPSRCGMARPCLPPARLNVILRSQMQHD